MGTSLTKYIQDTSTFMVRLVSYPLLGLFAHVATAYNQQAAIHSAVQTRFGNSVTDSISQHGCWASKLDKANSAWNGGSYKADDVDQAFAHWFRARACLWFKNAECWADANAQGCVNKLAQIDTHYLNKINAGLGTPGWVVKNSASECATAYRPPKDDHDDHDHVSSNRAHAYCA